MGGSPRSARAVRLVYPHQLHECHLQVVPGTVLVVVEDGLFYGQLPFNAHKLVLHHASVRRFADRARERGLQVEIVPSSASRTSGSALVELITRLRPSRVTVLDVVDDWGGRACREQLREGGYELRREDVGETPGFLTSREQVAQQLGGWQPRMQHFYAWQRRRLEVLGRPGGQPVVL